MIDRRKRNQYAELVRHFVGGGMTNDDYEERVFEIMEGTDDLGIEEVYWQVYNIYSDCRTHYLADEQALTRDAKKAVARWLLFLYSDAECETVMAEGEFKEAAGKWRCLGCLVVGVGLLIMLIGLHRFLFDRCPVVGVGLLLTEVLAVLIAVQPRRVEQELADRAWEVAGIWPFMCEENYAEARLRPPLLAGHLN